MCADHFLAVRVDSTTVNLVITASTQPILTWQQADSSMSLLIKMTLKRWCGSRDPMGLLRKPLSEHV